jgi:molybdenum cofactor cytidylyltransferase
MTQFRTKHALGAILLAAGASTRMGCVKLLLPWNNSTLLEHSIEQLKESEIDFFVVVLGANQDIIRKKVNFDGIDVVVNSQWQKGMATSIASGVSFLLKKKPEIQSVLVALSDQPLLDYKYYNSLIDNILISKNKIVASSYSDALGVPAIFDRDYFDDLLNLEGSQGARSLLRGGSVKVTPVNAGELALDLDTRETYNRVYEQHGRL